MMYLSYTNDGLTSNKDKEQYLLAVVLNDEVFNNLRKIIDVSNSPFPYPVSYSFVFPNDQVRLLESDFIDELLEDRKNYQSWEIGGDDPLEYYRFLIHPYEPKEDFWYSTKPDKVLLTYGHHFSFGFDAYHNGETYYGYAFDWKDYLNRG